VQIDLNADLGEGFGRWSLGDDEALLNVITSANIACGFHAGDPVTMLRVCEQAAARGVTIGAQVGYRDLAGFGRRKIDMAPDDLTADVLYQLGALNGCARAAGSHVSYVKPHGALYNTAVVDPVQAAAIVEAIVRYDRTLPVLTLPGSALAIAASESGVTAVSEAFADRAYRADGTLVPREQPGAVLHDSLAIAARAVTMVTNGTVITQNGTEITMAAHSLCLHGDTPGAVEIAHAVRAALAEAGVYVRPFRR